MGARDTPAPPATRVARGIGLGPEIQDTGPRQAASVYGYEAADSKALRRDLQRATTFITFFVEGPPDVVENSQIMGGFHFGSPHPFMADSTLPSNSPYRSSYVIEERYDPISKGVDEETWDKAYEVTKVTILYQQRPCPHVYEDREHTALASFPEWYTLEKTLGTVGVHDNPEEVQHRFLLESWQSMPVLRPVPIVVRFYPRVILGNAQRVMIREQAGRTSDGVFLDLPEDSWILDSVDMRPIFMDTPSDPNGTGIYEVTLTFRADPYRQHQFWRPKPDPESHLPIEPTPSDNYADLHIKMSVLPRATVGFDTLVTISPDSCG